MANIKDLIKSIEAADSSFDEKLAAINQMEQTLVAMRQQEEQAVQDNVDLIVEAIKVMERKVESQLEIAKSIVPEKGDKGDKGERGLDGKNGLDGKDGRDGINGRDGQDGQDGVSVTDAKIDFDGSLVITLSTGQEINVGEVVAPELQEKIKLVTSGGAGTVLPTQTGNANKYLKTDGSNLSWATVSGGSGTVTSVGGTGTVSGISLSGTVTTSGNLTLGGTLDLSSPPAIGSTAASTGAFTTLSASSTVSGTGFSTYLASPPAIGGTTPAAGTFTTLIGGGGSANYGQLTGGATTKAVEFQTLGSDTNIALVLDSKGTGAIDLAAGSSGVNISNGGTVTAITRTAGGTGYTVAPTVVISAPTTAGGTQATATCTVTAGVVDTNFTITNAGTGYVEQPTITFTPVSGGSGATAYATIGSNTAIKNLGNITTFATPNSNVLAIVDKNSAGNYPTNSTVAFSMVPQQSNFGASYLGFGSAAYLGTISTTSTAFQVATSVSSPVSNGGGGVTQFAVGHTASAVNYVQVTGGATGSPATVTISGQGSSTDIDISLAPKGAGKVKTSSTGIQLVGSTSGFVGLKGAAVAGSTTYTLPAADGTSGQVLSTNGSAVLSWATGTLAKQTDAYTSGTAATYTAPANTQWVKITVVGKGGNGGGTTSQRGSGGGAGGVSIKWIPITAGQTLTYTVNAVSLPNSVTSGTYILASDIIAYGGTAGTSVAYAASFTAGGLGGSATGGDINIRGGYGGSAFGTSTAVGTQQSGFGGSNMFGAGGYAVGIAINNGIDGLGYGAGGSGSVGSTTVGLGQNGIIIFEAY